MIIWFWNGKIAKEHGKKLGWSGWLIRLRSWQRIHTEIQFSKRRGGISFSATLRDGCKCCRFKMLDYEDKPWWEPIHVEITAEQEDRAWDEACRMAGLPWDFIYPFRFIAEKESGDIFYGPNAIKYDILGMVCHISKWRIIRPNSKRTWCSKACNKVFIAGIGREDIQEMPMLVEREDELMPEEMYKYMK